MLNILIAIIIFGVFILSYLKINEMLKRKKEKRIENICCSVECKLEKLKSLCKLDSHYRFFEKPIKEALYQYIKSNGSYPDINKINKDLDDYMLTLQDKNN